MSKKSIGYVILVLVAFVIGTQTNIELKSSQVVTSDDIAVVNNDQKVKYLDEDVKFGDDFVTLIDSLDTNYNYQTTSSAEADQGLISGKYAASVTVPSNFTKGILSVNSENPTPTSITYALNADLPASKSKKIETEIISSINDFENNITYMYLYSIFDGLHSTQEGVKTVAENGMPVFTFLQELGEIDIVGSHEYELKDNNTDSFDSIDISEQLAAFGKTVSDYKQDVANVIEVYKKQGEKYNNEVDEAIAEMNNNNDLLNERIDNVEDTLQTIVESNEQFTEDEYSITGASSNLTNIIVDYIEQLKIVNDTVDNNNNLIRDSKTIDRALTKLNNNDHYSWLKLMVQSRVKYYQSLDKIVETCFNNPEANVNTCVNNKLGSYKNKFSDYDSYISMFKQEEDYYDTMSYYLEQIAADSAAKEVEADEETVSFDVPIETSEVANSKVEDSESGDLEQVDDTAIIDQVELSATSYGQNMTATDDSDSNLVELAITNLNGIEELTIDTSASSNVASITPLDLNQNNCDITIDGNKIEITNIEATQLNLVFDVEKTLDGNDATVDFKIGRANSNVTVGEKNPLTVTPTIDAGVLTLDYKYKYQADDEIVNYQGSSLATSYGSDSFVLINDGDGAVTLDASNNGFVIDGTGAKAGDEITFSIEFNHQLPSGVLVENYTINDEENSFIIINEQMSIDTILNISDDPYTLEETIGHENDDVDITENNEIEPGEQVGIKYKVELASDQPFSVSSLSFDLDFPTEVFSSLSSEQIIVEQDETVIEPTIETNEANVNIDFNTVIDAEAQGDGNYKLIFNIYLNPIANQEFMLGDLEADYIGAVNDLIVTANDVETTTNSRDSDDLNLAIGKPELTSVKYEVGGSSCVGAKSLEECELEAGEPLTKTITISNTGNDMAAGVTLKDSYIGNNSSLIETNSEYTYTLTTNGTEETDVTDSNYYVTEDEDSGKALLHLTIPADSSITIVEPLTVNENIASKQTLINNIQLGQYNQDLGYKAETAITVTPLKLKVEIIDDEQMVEDGVITPNEAVNITLEVTNKSARGISHNDNIKITASDESVIDYVDLISVEDSEWNTVVASNDNPSEIKISNELKPGDSLTIKLRIKFNDLSTGSSSETLTFTPYKEGVDADDVCTDTNCDQITYSLAVNPDYVQLAKDQAANVAVIGDELYSNSLEKSEDLVNQGSIIAGAIDTMRGYMGNYGPLTIGLERFTVENNEELEGIRQAIQDYGLGFETEDDEDKLASYEYCTDNSEVSCQLFGLYNKITNKEGDAKTYFGKLLATIDPSNEEQLGTKPSDDGTEEPTNIGADFNGYGGCVEADTPEGEECEQINPGINQRIEIQGEDVQAVQDKIDKILGNELTDIDNEPYQEQLAQINESTNKEMADVETKNNELFGKKIDVYNENYDRVMKYVDEISKDPAYDDAIEKFKNEEITRQQASLVILENVYNILPNTVLDGLPNRLVYSFIANPVNVVKAETNNPIDTVVTADHGILIAVIAAVMVLTAVLLFILYWINRGV